LIWGWLTDSHWMAELVADRLIYNSATNRPTQAGSYTMMLPGMSVCGNGIGTVKVDKAGNVVWNGTLADGTSVSQATTLSKQGRWPLYASVYGGTGEVISWMQFSSQPDSDLTGQTIWIKPASRAAYYPLGTTNGRGVQLGRCGSLQRRGPTQWNGPPASWCLVEADWGNR